MLRNPVQHRLGLRNRAAIIAQHKLGKTIAQIVKILHLTDSCIYRHLIKAGLRPVPPPSWGYVLTNKDKRTIIRMWIKQGRTMLSISKELNIPANKVWLALKDASRPCRICGAPTKLPTTCGGTCARKWQESYECKKNSFKRYRAKYPQKNRDWANLYSLRVRTAAKKYLGNRCCVPECQVPPEQLNLHHRNGDGAAHRKLLKASGQATMLRHWARIGRPTEQGQQFALQLACPLHHAQLDALLRSQGKMARSGGPVKSQGTAAARKKMSLIKTAYWRKEKRGLCK